MQISNKIEHFESLNHADIISRVFIYIDDRIAWSKIYSDLDVSKLTETAIKKLLDGTHAWDIEKDPDPTRILQNNVWRAICHEMEKRARNEEYKSFHNPIDYDALLDDSIVDDTQWIDNDEEISSDKIWEWLKHEAETQNEDAWYYLETTEELLHKFNKIPKRSIIAKHLGWNLEKATNVKRWIKRKFEYKIHEKTKGASI